jgi:hypothetical protein
VGDRVLVRRVRFKEGPHKLEDRWDDGIYEVIAVPEGKTGVYDVCQEGKPKSRTRRLHRNLLLPIGHVPAEVTAKPAEKSSRKVTATPITDDSASSSSDSEADLVYRHTRSQGGQQESQVSEAEEQESSSAEASGEEAFDDLQRQREIPGNVPPVPVLLPDAQASAPDERVVEPPQPTPVPPIPAPRRSNRERRPPHWQTTGEYVLSQQARYELLQQILDKL